jgi:hypothetical protein
MNRSTTGRGPSLAELEAHYDAYLLSSLATENGLGYDDGECPHNDGPRAICMCPVCEGERRLSAPRMGVVLAVRAYRAGRAKVLEEHPIPSQERYDALISLIELGHTHLHWMAPVPPILRYRDDFYDLLDRHRREAMTDWEGAFPEPELTF